MLNVRIRTLTMRIGMVEQVSPCGRPVAYTTGPSVPTVSQQPRDWLHDPAAFGHRALRDSDWKQPRADNKADQVAHRAARIQHEIVRRATRRNAGETWTTLHASADMDMSLDRLWKITRGEATMNLRQLADLTRALGDLIPGLAE